MGVDAQAIGDTFQGLVGASTASPEGPPPLGPLAWGPSAGTPVLTVVASARAPAGWALAKGVLPGRGWGGARWRSSPYICIRLVGWWGESGRGGACGWIFQPPPRPRLWSWGTWYTHTPYLGCWCPALCRSLGCTSGPGPQFTHLSRDGKTSLHCIMGREGGGVHRRGPRPLPPQAQEAVIAGTRWRLQGGCRGRWAPGALVEGSLAQAARRLRGQVARPALVSVSP